MPFTNHSCWLYPQSLPLHHISFPCFHHSTQEQARIICLEWLRVLLLIPLAQLSPLLPAPCSCQTSEMYMGSDAFHCPVLLHHTCSESQVQLHARTRMGWHLSMCWALVPAILPLTHSAVLKTHFF